MALWRQREGDKAPTTKSQQSQLFSQEPLGLSMFLSALMEPGAIWDTPMERFVQYRPVINTFLSLFFQLMRDSSIPPCPPQSCHQDFTIFLRFKPIFSGAENHRLFWVGRDLKTMKFQALARARMPLTGPGPHPGLAHSQERSSHSSGKRHSQQPFICKPPSTKSIQGRDFTAF